jgi:hypothetical protein
MLERIALHQTRLHTPGLGLDGKGVALGAKGLVLLSSIDRLVALLAAYTRERSLEDVLPSLTIHAVRSRLGVREIALEVAAESSDRMDRLAETARLVDGFTFTGTSRHFVEYRDAAAPFGYDATKLLATDAALALYHERFTQTYDVERPVDLRALLLMLTPHLYPNARAGSESRFLVAEQGLGPALMHYLVRSRVEGEVCVAEWPRDSLFDEAPVRRWVFRIHDLPPRMRPLFESTPGITSFAPAGAGVAVETGFRHPVELRACPLFDPAGLVLIRGRGAEPWVIEKLPLMGALAAFARVEVLPADRVLPSARVIEPEPISVPLRLERSSARWRRVMATWIGPEQLPLLRRLAYALPRSTVAQATIALTSRGAWLRSSAGIEDIPLGVFFVEIHPRLYVPAGHEVVPAVAPEVLAQALGASPNRVMFLGADARAFAIEESGFVPLESVLIEAPAWEALVAREVAVALEEAVIDLKVTPVGLLPLRGVEPPPEAPANP